ncbi:hypothetical protein SPRG_20895 [Saprolegnia parasitica CBS 223.65]|uniref:Helicase-associated domain-containing protein n=1 Tax=Saprolegnia parasitica (strain CBS 223.65) TaxID=695850 RepID=A0A067CCM9_SAPPC|nr:hypothetical protein SPRG_20895 [Saprolegnia parasitica CBS 223.65]KDO24572.1 hypothetical protein SPRG_20895 [Saprolegnia parasitica CBS 223.65]|eukprot:XP_012204730.1 hypothetical protein SPRG_20895 [Saprolegnia parasitica CBS 223.65]
MFRTLQLLRRPATASFASSAMSYKMSLSMQEQYANVAHALHELTAASSDYTCPPRGVFLVPSEAPWPIEARGRELYFSHFRVAYRRKHLAADIVAAMDDIRFVWNPWAHRWTLTLTALETFKALHGHLLVPGQYVIPHSAPFPRDVWGMQLGYTVDNLRRRAISADRRDDLDAIGFVWDHPEHAWRLKVDAVVHHYALYGHTAIDKAYVVPYDAAWPTAMHGLKLGQNVNYMRSRKHEVNEDDKAALAHTDFDWDPRSSAWRIKLAALTTYIRLHGHSRITHRFVVPVGDAAWPPETWGLALGAAMPYPDRVAALDTLGVKRIETPPAQGQK